MKTDDKQTEGHNMWGQRLAGVIVSVTKKYRYLRDRKSKFEDKKEKCSGLKGRGSPFSPLPRFFISRLNHAAVMKILFHAATTVEAGTNEMPVSQDVS